MTIQQKISLVNNQKRIGKIYDVLVEESMGNNLFKGRTFFQAPEVDGVTDIHSRNLDIGSFVRVKIEEASEYDLKGNVL